MQFTPVEIERRKRKQVRLPAVATYGRFHRTIIVRMLSQGMQTMDTPCSTKDQARGSISNALIACMPYFAFGCEVHLLLTSCNDNATTVAILITQNGGEVVVGLEVEVFLYCRLLRWSIKSPSVWVSMSLVSKAFASSRLVTLPRFTMEYSTGRGNRCDPAT